MEQELTSKEKGNLTELQCLTSFYELGYKVSIPYGENSRYDFILDIEGKLYKIQCKTSRFVSDEAFKFACQSARCNSSGVHYEKYSKEQIDFFATFYNGKCYLVPIEECGAAKTLRYCYPSNGQKKGISLACDYELREAIKRLK